MATSPGGPMDSSEHLTYHMDLSEVREALRKQMNSSIDNFFEAIRGSTSGVFASLTSNRPNISDTERMVSTLSGGALLGYGLFNMRTIAGMLAAAGGAALLYRGMTGHCDIYESLGIDTRHTDETSATGATGTDEYPRRETGFSGRRPAYTDTGNGEGPESLGG